MTYNCIPHPYPYIFPPTIGPKYLFVILCRLHQLKEGTVTCLADAATVLVRMNQKDVGSVLFLDMAVEIFGAWGRSAALTGHPATTVDPKFCKKEMIGEAI